MVIGFFIGVDGGGSGTRARIWAAPDGRLLGSGAAGPSSLSQGLAQARANVAAAIAAAMAAAGSGTAIDALACAVGMGLAGAHDAALRSAFLRDAPAFGALALDTDGHAALLGAHGGRPGVVVAAGTGSVGEVLRADGSRRVAGGWGFPSGDEGSGAWMGLRAMALAQQSLDGRGSTGPLARAVLQHTGGAGDAADAGDAVRAWLGSAGQQRYAELAPLVFAHEAADPAAAALVAQAVQALQALADALDPAAALPLAVVGSIGTRLAPRLPAAMQARRVAPAGDAVDGALLLARRAALHPHPHPA